MLLRALRDLFFVDEPTMFAILREVRAHVEDPYYGPPIPAEDVVAFRYWVDGLPDWRVRREYRKWINFFMRENARNRKDKAIWERVDHISRELPRPPG